MHTGAVLLSGCQIFLSSPIGSLLSSTWTQVLPLWGGFHPHHQVGAAQHTLQGTDWLFYAFLPFLKDEASEQQQRCGYGCLRFWSNETGEWKCHQHFWRFGKLPIFPHACAVQAKRLFSLLISSATRCLEKGLAGEQQESTISLLFHHYVCTEMCK